MVPKVSNSIVRAPKRWLSILALLTDSVMFRNAQTRQLSHPLPVLRAREIDEWSRSPDYKNLFKRAVQMNPVQNV